MKIKDKNFKFLQIFFLVIYYGLLKYLPGSGFPLLGLLFKKMRYVCCKHIFSYCGKNVNIERGAVFGSGINLFIGDYSGLGFNSVVPGNIIIGKYVMMGPNCYILGSNHDYSDTTVPMMFQGDSTKKQTLIEDDVWIGRNVIMTPGRTIKRGSIIAAGCVLSKDFPDYSIIGGNPSKLIKSRKKE